MNNRCVVFSVLFLSLFGALVFASGWHNASEVLSGDFGGKYNFTDTICIRGDCKTAWPGGGSVSNIATGNGLTGGPITTTGTISINSTYTQRRVLSSCSAGNSIRAINEDGTVDCESDDVGSGVGGSGTTNYLAKFTAGTTIGNSLVYDNGASVGIGTTNPTGKLSIYSANDGSGDSIQLHGGSASASKYAFINVHDTSEYIRLGYFNGSAIRNIFLDGNVGVGVSSPSANLHVRGVNNAGRVAIIENDVSSGNPEGLLVLTAQNGGTAPKFAVGTGNSAGYTNNFVVTNAGSVGIGTQDPGSYKLSVNGNLQSSGKIRKFSNEYDVYSWYYGGVTDLGWKTIANVNLPAGLYTGLSLQVKIIDADTNFGSNAVPKELQYYVAMRRSSDTPDNINDAVVNGPIADYVRVVKTATGVYELQVRSIANWKHNLVEAQVISTNAGTISYVDNPVDGSTTGTIYMPTQLENTYVSNLIASNSISINGQSVVTSNSLSNYVAKAGDTMTGTLQLRNIDIRGTNTIEMIKFGSAGNYQILHGTGVNGLWGRNTLGVHIDTPDAFGVYSSGWVQLMGVQGGTGEFWAKGNIHANTGSRFISDPNPTWGRTLYLGGDGRTGLVDTLEPSVAATDGNLHIDAGSGKALYLNYYDGSSINFGNGGSATVASMDNSGQFWQGSNKYWHAGNDGASSGLDADLLDGLSSASFMSASTDNWVNTAGDTMTGTLTYSSGTGIGGTGIPGLVMNNAGWNSLMMDGSGSTKSLVMHYGAAADNQIRFGRYADNFGGWEANPMYIDMDAPSSSWTFQESGQFIINGNALRVQGWGGTANDGVIYFGTGDNYIYRTGSQFTFNVNGAYQAYLNSGGTIWTTNNDGSGSGLDADTIDGSHASAFATSSHTHTGNQISSPWNNAAYDLDTAKLLRWKNYGSSHVIFDASQGTSPTGSGVGNTNPDIAWSATYPTLMGWNGANTYGVRVDSARYADYVGGLGTGSFVRTDASTSVAASVTTSFLTDNAGMATANGDYASLEARGTGGAAYMQFHRPGVYAAYFGLDTDNQFKVGGWSMGANAYKLWHEGNDGVGSGLSADNLDGADSSYFTDIPSRLGYTPVNKAGDSMTGALTVTNTAIGVTAIRGEVTATSGINYGVYGLNAAYGAGVYGENTGTFASSYGGHFKSAGGRAVFGEATSAAGATYGGYFSSVSTGGTGVRGVASSASGTTYGVYGISSSASGYDFYAAGAGTDYGTSSSLRWKKNITELESVLPNLDKIKAYRYVWDEEHGNQSAIGFLGEEFGQVYPEFVEFDLNSSKPDYYVTGMDYSKVTVVLLKAVQELKAEKDSEIEALKQENTQLKENYSNLLARVEALENK